VNSIRSRCRFGAPGRILFRSRSAHCRSGVRGLVMFSLGLVHLNKYRTSYERLRQPVLPDLQIIAFMLVPPLRR